MTTLDALFHRFTMAVLAVLALVGVLGPCGCTPDPSAVGVERAEPELEPARELEPELMLETRTAVRPSPRPAAPPATTRPDERVRWCEPLDQPWCETSSDCPGRQRCVTPWWSSAEGAKVCALPYPTRGERKVVRDQLRVVADDLCSGSCSASDLHRFVATLALRESSYRPDKRHRLSRDIEGALEAWREQASTYAGNPAYPNSDRWTTGLGLFGQNPALWLRRWDPMAPPETLCGVVESTVALLRRAREHVTTLERRGLICEGKRYHGSACTNGHCRPSWYDASLVNSAKQCPTPESLARFADRAHGQGLDPLAPISAASLGHPTPTEGQDAWAAELRTKM
jgi:hypothetical protein